MIEVIARSGERAFLIKVADGLASVLDIEAEPFPAAPVSVDTVLSRGYWEQFVGDDGPVLELARRVATEGEELPTGGWDAREGARRLLGVVVEPNDLVGVHVSATGTLPVAVEAGAIFVGTSFGIGRRYPETAGAR